MNDKDREEEPLTLPFKWNPTKLAWDMNALVTISLWGYRESTDLYPSLTYIDTLAEGVRLGVREYELALDVFKDRYNHGLTDITFGYLAINLTNPRIFGDRVKTSPVIWSRTMPLAWYFKPQWDRIYKYQWKEEMCKTWFDRESWADRFATTNFKCPCTRQQALLDKGRFSPDLECNIVDRKCDTFHRGALDCFRSGRPSIGGSGQKCCYDDWEELIQTADTMYGGRPSRAFIYGKHPYKMRMMIPALRSVFIQIYLNMTNHSNSSVIGYMTRCPFSSAVNGSPKKTTAKHAKCTTTGELLKTAHLINRLPLLQSMEILTSSPTMAVTSPSMVKESLL